MHGSHRARTVGGRFAAGQAQVGSADHHQRHGRVDAGDLQPVDQVDARAQVGVELACGDLAVERLQQERGLADAGVAADQHHAAFDHATAQHPVQLVDAGGVALKVGRFDL